MSIATTLFALSFVFAETAKNIFNSFIFLFVRHPFDGELWPHCDRFERMISAADTHTC